MELGLIVSFGLFVGGLTGLVIRGKKYSVSGDLLLGAFGALIGLNVAVSFLGANPANGYGPASYLLAIVASFALVALTRLDTRSFARNRLTR